jgi:undecaprenyl-diphosphatase
MHFWATMVAVSRIFVGKHYLGDILVGSLVGIAAGFLFANIARIIISKYIR